MLPIRVDAWLMVVRASALVRVGGGRFACRLRIPSRPDALPCGIHCVRPAAELLGVWVNRRGYSFVQEMQR